jgi:bifunctional non-homologous end joining protein LigD
MLGPWSLDVLDSFAAPLYSRSQMLLRPSALPVGFIEPCLPTSAHKPPSGESWFHEIKWDGFRVIARKTGERIKLYSRPGNELTSRFPLIVAAVAKLRAHSCIIDGEAVACCDDGIACFELIRSWDTDASVFLWAFDLIELNGQDMRREPLEMRKATLEGMLSREDGGICFNEHISGDGETRFPACLQTRSGRHRLQAQGLALYRGRTLHWIKTKNPQAPAVKREAEEDWGRWPRRSTR